MVAESGIESFSTTTMVTFKAQQFCFSCCLAIFFLWLFGVNASVQPQSLRGNGSRDGAVVRALPFHQCDPGFDSRPRCHMWVEFVVGSRIGPRGFSPGTPVFPSPQKPTFLNSNLIWTQWTKSHSVDVTLLIPIYLLFIYL